MRIEISYSGLGGSAVSELQSNLKTYIIDTENVISSFRKIKNSTLALNGGTGTLQGALENIEARIRYEENKLQNADLVRIRVNQFSELATQIDDSVSKNVNKNKNEFYGVNPWLRPVTSVKTEQKWYEQAWNYMTDISGPKGDKSTDIPYDAAGSAGGIVGVVDGAINAKNAGDWGKVGVDAVETISDIAEDYKHYNKIGRAIGTANADGLFWKNFFGLSKAGSVSKASSLSTRFYNNLHKTNVFDSFTGKQGAVSSAASWAGVALSGVTNAYSNIEEMNESGGKMSTGRYFAETISETVIDTALYYGTSALIGAGIAAITGAAAAPLLVAAATGLALWGLNSACQAVFETSATEAISDFTLNTLTLAGNAVADGVTAAADWFGKLFT